ncbi:hypothetical protein JCM14076_23860 [Methylosoma difficile]
MGSLLQAKPLYEQVLQAQPKHFDALHYLGLILHQTGDNAEAIRLITQSIAINGNFASHNNLANIYNAERNTAAAIGHYQKAIALKPDFADAYNNLGVVYKEQNNLLVAIAHYQKAITFNPQYAVAYCNLATALKDSNQLEAAVAHYQKAISLQPDYADAYNGLASALNKLNQFPEAIFNYQKAIALNPHSADAYCNLGHVLRLQKNLLGAIDCYQKALEIKPNLSDALGNLFYSRQYCCDWTDYPITQQQMVNAVMQGVDGYKPLSFLAVTDSAQAQQQCALTFSQKYYPAQIPLVRKASPRPSNKIRIAYVSADFREHALSILMVELFELHDKNRFEVIAIALRPASKTDLGQRVKNAFSQFIEVADKSDSEVAQLMVDLEIDIAVDLMGFTANNRTAIFSYRPAPIQINYLGYPGSMSAEYIDYILADTYIIPHDFQQYYQEKIIYLPDCFQVNDRKRFIPPQIPTRAALGLPEQALVLCSFNNSYKFTPTFFRVWMAILKAVPHSVLWLFAGNPQVRDNLVREAQRQGVEEARLIFTQKVPYQHYLANYPLADLFLDTLPFNGGTTVSDALWMGVPVLTCSGQAFAARMAGSLLRALGLPELVTDNLADYQATAIKLATTPLLLADIRAKLAQNRHTYPLFKTDLFCRHLESAYQQAWQNYQNGQPPSSFAIPPTAS